MFELIANHLCFFSVNTIFVQVGPSLPIAKVVLVKTANYNTKDHNQPNSKGRVQKEKKTVSHVHFLKQFDIRHNED